MASVASLMAMGLPKDLAIRVARIPDTVVTDANLTDNSGGTASDTIAAIGVTYDQAEVRNAVASLAAKVNACLNALRNGGMIS